MVVDGFEVLGFHAVPSDAGIRIQLSCNLSDDILHKHGMVVSVFGDGLFVPPFEESVEGAGCRTFDQIDEFFDPNETVVPYLDHDDGALVVGPAVGQFPGTGAECRDWDFHAQDEIFPVGEGSDQGTAVLHQAFCFGDRGLFLDKIGEGDFHVCFLGMELFLHFLEDFPDGIDVKIVVVLVENFYETAHVSSPEAVGKINVHVDGAHGVL